MTRLAALLALLLALLAAPLSPALAKGEPVILIGIDGFKPDYLDRGITPNLSRLARNGVTARMRPSFPTKTFPNHYTLVTGLRPDHHGIVGNTMIDPRRPGQMFMLGDAKQSLDPFWWNAAEPIWITAERAGKRTATMFWPGSELAYGSADEPQTRAQDWVRFDMAVSNLQRVNTLLDWMRRPRSARPDFATIYFDNVDMAGHRFGPVSKEVDEAIADVDTHVGTLIAGLRAMGVRANIVVAADHGMAPSDEAKVIQLDDLIDRASYVAVETGPYAAIEPVTGTDNRVFDALIKPHDHMTCMRKEDLPERLHWGKNARVAAIVCLAENGWTILSGAPYYPVKGGNHGWDNAWPEMDALFIGSGPAFRRGVRGETFDNVDVYPLLARLIGITPRASDGDAGVSAAWMAR